jgi:UDPglucose 6-dehydrogenase
MMRQKITVVGIGYVGLGVGVMLSTRHDVTMLDVDQKKVDLINGRKSPIKDEMISRYLGTKESISISATTDSRIAYDGADFIIVAVPTNYDEETKKFDTRIVENVVNEAIGQNQNAIIVIKSTIPVGYTAGLIERLEKQGFNNPKVLFSPEFLREGTALKDNLFPSRIIVGYKKGDREQFSLAGNYLQLIRSASEGDYQELTMGSTEAEAVKLFANTYLAMRVAYFNELDTYAECNGLNTKDIIEGMCYDPRIGNQYNNPSFGYGGYCFPKDTKQLLANFEGIPQNLIEAIVESNETRKNYIASTIKEKIDNEFGSKATVGIYKLAMKSGSDNSRQSAILDIIKKLTKSVYQILIVVYDPANPKIKNGGVVISEDNLDKFKEECDIIITNRYDSELDDVKDKVYTRDIFHNN